MKDLTKTDMKQAGISNKWWIWVGVYIHIISKCYQYNNTQQGLYSALWSVNEIHCNIKMGSRGHWLLKGSNLRKQWPGMKCLNIMWPPFDFMSGWVHLFFLLNCLVETIGNIGSHGDHTVINEGLRKMEANDKQELVSFNHQTMCDHTYLHGKSSVITSTHWWEQTKIVTISRVSVCLFIFNKSRNPYVQKWEDLTYTDRRTDRQTEAYMAHMHITCYHTNLTNQEMFC